MTSKSDKLREVVEYAIEKGWNPFGDTFPEWQITSQYSIYCLRIVDKEVEVDDYLQFPTVLYDHDFAKAVFGEQLCCYSCGQTEEQASGHCSYCDFVDHPYWFPIWKYHLKQAVISEDPIDYYHKFIKSHE